MTRTHSLHARPALGRFGRGSGFTLAEVAITIVIVGIGLTLVMQALTLAKVTAAHTRNVRLARELALLTIGRVEAGLFRDELGASFLDGSFADEGYAEFTFEVRLGDDTFTEQDEQDRQSTWIPFADDQYDYDDYEEEEETEPYEQVRVRVAFPKLKELSSELILERWIPWDQVYGEAEDEDGETQL